MRESYLDFEVQDTKLNYRWNCNRGFSRRNCLEATADLESDNTVRYSSHWGGSSQNKLRDEWTCGTTLALAYVLGCLSTTWL